MCRTFLIIALFLALAAPLVYTSPLAARACVAEGYGHTSAGGAPDTVCTDDDKPIFNPVIHHTTTDKSKPCAFDSYSWIDGHISGG